MLDALPEIGEQRGLSLQRGAGRTTQHGKSQPIEGRGPPHRGRRRPRPPRPPVRRHLRRRRCKQLGDSIAKSLSEAASSLKPKSMIQTTPSSARNMFASRRSRSAMRCDRTLTNSVHTRPSTSSVISFGSSRSSERPAIASYTRTKPFGSAVANTTRRGVRTPRSRAANTTSASCSTARRKVENAFSSPRVTRLDAAVDPEQQIGTALIGAERLDEQGCAVTGRAEVRRRATSRLACSSCDNGTPTASSPSAIEQPYATARREQR